MPTMAAVHSRNSTPIGEEEENEFNPIIPLDRNQEALIIYQFGHDEEDVGDPSHQMNLNKYAAILRNAVGPSDPLFDYITFESILKQVEEDMRDVKAIENSYQWMKEKFIPAHPENLEENLMVEMMNFDQSLKDWFILRDLVKDPNSVKQILNVARANYHSVPEYVKTSLGLTPNERPMSQELVITDFPLLINSANAAAMSASATATTGPAGSDSMIIFMLNEPNTFKEKDRLAVKAAIEGDDNDGNILGNNALPISTNIYLPDDKVNDDYDKQVNDDTDDGLRWKSWGQFWWQVR